MASVTIEHTHETGTTLAGSVKGDGVWEILKTVSPRWGFSKHVGIYVRGSRDHDADEILIRRTVADLTAAGHTVEKNINNTFRPAAERRADQDERADARVERLTARADRAAAESTARRDASRKITDGIPFGQPVQPPGHHSRNAHLNALARAQSHQQKSWEAADRAERLADRAAGTAANVEHRHNPRAIMRRVEKLEADVRAHTRELEGYTRTFRNNAGEIYTSDVFPPATGERAADLNRWIARANEEIEHLRGELAAMDAAGTFRAWAEEDFRPGDWANVGGDWREVKRVNRKSVSVIGRFYGDGNRATPVKFDEIHGRRRDGMQWDAPNGAPWPVETARKVAKWRGLVAAARRDNAAYGTAEHTANRHVHYAMRITHGLDLSASGREVSTIADSIDGTDARRALAIAYLAVFDRLQAGETVPAIVADVTPITGAPAWRIPTDREPVTARAGRGWPALAGMRFVEPGDLIVGRRDRGGSGQGQPRLIRDFCGPVAAVSDVVNRREAGDWVTITLTDGTARECKTGEWYEVHPAGTWETDTDTPAQDAPAADQAAEYLTGDALTAACLADSTPVGESADEDAPGPRIISGPHAPLATVTACDIGGEPLDPGFMWWLVAATDPSNLDDRHAACATHTGVDPLAYTPAVPRSAYMEAVERATERPTVGEFEDEDAPGAATLTVYDVRDGHPDEFVRRESVTLPADTDAEAQSLADATAATEPIRVGVGVRVLVGRDSVPHAYRTGFRAALPEVPDGDADTFVSDWATLDLGSAR